MLFFTFCNLLIARPSLRTSKLQEKASALKKNGSKAETPLNPDPDGDPDPQH